jgi:predicted tellurium resistance membrane protein TerC
MGAREDLEHAEHIVHSGSARAKHIGLTMGLLAVLVALAASLAGTERNELVASVMDQSWAHSSYAAATVKFRIVMVELEKMRNEAEADDAEGASPSLERFLRLYSDYKKEIKLAETWDDTCEPLIDAHFDAAESYDRGLLIAELAIIVASIAVLLTSRIAWLISIAIGICCLGQLSLTFIRTHHAVTGQHAKVERAEEAYQKVVSAHFDSTKDEETVEALDPGGKIRKRLKE